MNKIEALPLGQQKVLLKTIDKFFKAQKNKTKEPVMELVEIKNKIHNTIEGLPLHKLKIALDFLQDLQISDEDETQAPQPRLRHT